MIRVWTIFQKCIGPILVCRFAGRDFGSERGHFGAGSKSSTAGAGLVKPQWDLNRLPKFEKHFYKEHPLTVSRSPVCVIYPVLDIHQPMFFCMLFFINYICDIIIIIIIIKRW